MAIDPIQAAGVVHGAYSELAMTFIVFKLFVVYNNAS
jgi:hypothetical protein